MTTWLPVLYWLASRYLTVSISGPAPGSNSSKAFFQGLLAVGFIAPFLEDQQPRQDTVHMHLGRIFFGERQHHVLQRGLGGGITDVALAAA